MRAGEDCESLIWDGERNRSESELVDLSILFFGLGILGEEVEVGEEQGIKDLKEGVDFSVILGFLFEGVAVIFKGSHQIS